MITEIATNPQYALSSSSGRTGSRAWTLEAGDNLNDFVRMICRSHWPCDPNSVPVQITVGPFMDNATLLHSNGLEVDEDSELDGSGQLKIRNELPTFNMTLVTCHYQFLRLSNCWPAAYEKPMHYKGTTLSLQIRGTGQTILASPFGFRPRPAEINIQQAIGFTQNTRFLIPLTEFHVSCDRLTKSQLDSFNPTTTYHDTNPDVHGWDRRVGTVNNATFMSQPPGTLIFDSYNLEETFAPDLDDPCRYKITAILKARHPLDGDANFATLSWYDSGQSSGQEDDTSGQDYVGWNQDYWTNWELGGWITFLVKNNVQDSGQADRLRYPAVSFDYLFVDHVGDDVEYAMNCGSASCNDPIVSGQ